MDKKEWFTKREIKPITINTIGYFTTAWNLFEHYHMDKYAREDEIRKKQFLFLSDEDHLKLNELMNDYREQVYIKFPPHSEGYTQEFIELYFYPPRKETPRNAAIIASFMNGDNNELSVCLTSICRIRNNLLHGSKNIDTINKQRKLIHSAADILAYLTDLDNLKRWGFNI